jgi:hypothetical protein
VDEFAYCTPDTKAGILHIRELSDAAVLAIGRDGEFQTREFWEVNAFMHSLKGDGDRPTNPMWIVGEALEEAFRRRLIDGEQLDHYRREVGL